MEYEIVLSFHVIQTGLKEVTYIVRADSHESAFKAALTMKDHDFPNQQLKDVNVYLRD